MNTINAIRVASPMHSETTTEITFKRHHPTTGDNHHTYHPGAASINRLEYVLKFYDVPCSAIFFTMCISIWYYPLQPLQRTKIPDWLSELPFDEIDIKPIPGKDEITITNKHSFDADGYCVYCGYKKGTGKSTPPCGDLNDRLSEFSNEYLPNRFKINSKYNRKEH